MFSVGGAPLPSSSSHGGPLAAGSISLAHPTDCSNSGGTLQVSFDLSNPGWGKMEVEISQGEFKTFTTNSTCTLAPGLYEITASPENGASFVEWVPNGEVLIGNPTQESTGMNVSSSPVGVEAVFAAPSAPAAKTGWVWLVLAIAIVVAVVGALLYLRSRHHLRAAQRAKAAAAPAEPRPVAPSAATGPSAPTGPPGTAPSPSSLAAWTRYASSVVEGIREEDLWPAVARVGSPSALLCFTWGRTETLTSKYKLEGAQVVRISRVEASTPEHRVAPSDVDKIVDLLEKHFHAGTGRTAVLPDVHALVSAAGAQNVIRLLEIGRDLALDQKGSVLFTLDPTALTVANVALLERGAHKLTMGP